ncbi:hypothetical protein Rhe02_14700 [Rhizocola hellebori]|uniref:Integrase n=1 Tax=Rhizocola hellebori TaxID=1392758 RepID=A0A8J3VEX1_9ACTN|nr:tyrosine-type recombinase/integrase [Rhizocola hellebori]GIH03403.1 hypothetical protein Rhe02_14700 [Rhizocola hellebori]
MSAEVDRLLAGAPDTWKGFLRDWDRCLRAANHPLTTRYNYLLAARQLAAFVDNTGPSAVSKADIESFQVWMIQTRSASTALNKYKALQQFFRWLVDDEEIERSPLAKVRQPRQPAKLIPIISEVDTTLILGTCRGRGFADLRDAAIIRLLSNTGARLAEIANLDLGDVDMDRDTIRYHGKGAKDRMVRFGPKTGRALSRYLRVRATRHARVSSRLWLATRGEEPLLANGIKAMLRRRGKAAGVAGVHAHRWRHNYAHQWKKAGGDTGDLMLVLGWSSEDMPRRYGASAAAERAQDTQARLRIGDDV